MLLGYNLKGLDNIYISPALFTEYTYVFHDSLFI